MYPFPGAPERTAALRSRYEQLIGSIARYEARVGKQTAQLARMSKHDDGDGDGGFDGDDGDEGEDGVGDGDDVVPEVQITEDDLRRENEKIEELERKRRVLEDRVSGMERDLGGLLR